LISGIVSDIRAEAQKKYLDFSVKTDPLLPVVLRGDSAKIREILLNLLTNAVKYTQKGCVKFTVARENDDKPEMCTLVFTVEDTGIGIKDEDKARLFQDFTRLDIDKNHNIPGTGLGLAIASSYSRAMGGSIRLESVYGKGSRFTFTLEQQVVHNAAPGNAPPSGSGNVNLEGVRVLVVDDVSTNLKVATGMVKALKATTEGASSADEALRKIVSGAKTQGGACPYDIILMDHMMPGKDGIEALSEIRAAGFTKVPVIALTANAISGMKEMFLASGFNDYLSKPINFAALQNVLRKWAR
jgi:CheY-like chemotaxis protein/anti-sigma regulatory factor (Ser/Thr protein kinase)